MSINDLQAVITIEREELQENRNNHLFVNEDSQVVLNHTQVLITQQDEQSNPELGKTVQTEQQNQRGDNAVIQMNESGLTEQNHLKQQEENLEIKKHIQDEQIAPARKTESDSPRQLSKALIKMTESVQDVLQAENLNNQNLLSSQNQISSQIKPNEPEVKINVSQQSIKLIEPKQQESQIKLDEQNISQQSKLSSRASVRNEQLIDNIPQQETQGLYSTEQKQDVEKQDPHKHDQIQFQEKNEIKIKDHSHLLITQEHLPQNENIVKKLDQTNMVEQALDIQQAGNLIDQNQITNQNQSIEPEEIDINKSRQRRKSLQPQNQESQLSENTRIIQSNQSKVRSKAPKTNNQIVIQAQQKEQELLRAAQLNQQIENVSPQKDIPQVKSQSQQIIEIKPQDGLEVKVIVGQIRSTRPPIQPIGQPTRPKKRMLSSSHRDLDLSGEISSIQGVDQSRMDKPKTIYHSTEAQHKAQELIRRMNLQRLDLEKRKHQEQQLQEKLYFQQDKDKQLLRDKELVDVKAEKRRRFLEKIDNEKQIKETASRINAEANKLVKQIQVNKKLQDQTNKQKEEDLIGTELERRKQELLRKRELSQPIRLDDLKEHQKKYEEDIKQKRLDRQISKDEAQLEHKARVHKFPKSENQQRIEDEDRMCKNKLETDLKAKKLQRLRQQKYVEVIKDLFPVPSIKKAIETGSPTQAGKKGFQPSIQNDFKRKFASIEMKGFLSGQRNLSKIEKVLIRNGRSQGHLVQQEDNESQNNDDQISEFVSQIKTPLKIKGKQQSKSIPKNTPYKDPSTYEGLIPAKKPTKDYLQEMRQQRQNQGPYQEDEWERIIKNEKLPLNSRYQNVLSQVQKLEQKARQKEKIANINGDTDAEQEANNLIVQSIKAKLALLEKSK